MLTSLEDVLRYPMTIEQGLKYQSDDLLHWKEIVNEEVYQALEEEAEAQNAELDPDADGYDVWRGNSITNWICNYKPKPLHNCKVGDIVVATCLAGIECIVKVEGVDQYSISGPYKMMQNDKVREGCSGFTFSAKFYDFRPLFS